MPVELIVDEVESGLTGKKSTNVAISQVMGASASDHDAMGHLCAASNLRRPLMKKRACLAMRRTGLSIHLAAPVNLGGRPPPDLLAFSMLRAKFCVQ